MSIKCSHLFTQNLHFVVLMYSSIYTESPIRICHIDNTITPLSIYLYNPDTLNSLSCRADSHCPDDDHNCMCIYLYPPPTIKRVYLRWVNPCGYEKSRYIYIQPNLCRFKHDQSEKLKIITVIYIMYSRFLKREGGIPSLVGPIALQSLVFDLGAQYSSCFDTSNKSCIHRVDPYKCWLNFRQVDLLHPSVKPAAAPCLCIFRKPFNSTRELYT